MLTQVADGVHVHESAFCQSNAVVVEGADGVLLVDPGVHAEELACLADDLAAAGHPVVAGFSTHPHWDHLLWHPDLGAPPRYGTETCASVIGARLAEGIDAQRFGIPDDVPLELLGLISGLPHGTIPWDGPRVRVIEHRAHAPGHAALLIEDRGVLVAGDMLSDVFMPMLNVHGSEDPLGDYLAALALLDAVADAVEVVVPGHGSVGGPADLSARIALDRAYVTAMAGSQEFDDPRIGAAAKPGWEWVADVHAGQVAGLAAKGGTD